MTHIKPTKVKNNSDDPISTQFFYHLFFYCYGWLVQIEHFTLFHTAQLISQSNIPKFYINRKVVSFSFIAT